MRNPLPLLLLLPLGCHDGHVEKSIPAVRVHALDRGASASVARYSASVEPRTRVEVAYKVGGYVAAITSRAGAQGAARLLQEGDVVKRGEVLARLRTSDFDDRMRQAQAALSEAQAGLEKATLDYGRARRLRVGEDVTQADLDNARVAVEAAQARTEGARARLAEASAALDDSILRSPLDGTVIRRTLEVGSLVGPGTAAFSIADLTGVKVVFGVPDTVVARLRPGTPQQVTAEAVTGKAFQGTLTRVSPAADPRTRLFEIEISIPNAEGLLKPGMIAALSLDLLQGAAAEQSFIVPLSAIVRSPLHREQYAVYLAEEAQGQTVVKAREVTLGEFAGSSIPVLSGLTGGERIVTSGASLLSDGEAVRVIP
jgi:multidrug efflux system membrane fusion protein